MRPHRRQPTRLPRPWDSPGKNTGVGCHFLLRCMKVKSESEVAQSCPTLSDHMDCSIPGSSIHGIFQARVLEWGANAFSWKAVWSFLKKLQIELPYDPTIFMYPLLRIYPKKTKTLIQKDTCTSMVIRSDQSLSRVRLFVTPWIAAHQASLSITNSRSSLRLTSI